MRIVYFGSPATAVAPLRSLVDAGHDVALVVSGADKRRGRGSALTPTPVKAAALDLGLSVTDDMSDALDIGAELGVVVAYGRIIPNSILDAFPLVNIHFSLLPRWRGAAPIERAILAGDTTTGVCLMAVEEGLDTGGVFRRVEIPIDSDDTAGDLHERLSLVGAKVLVESISEGLGDPVPQTEVGVTYAHKITADDRRVDPAMNVAEFTRRVRIGGAWTTLDGRRLKIAQARAASDPDSPQSDLSASVTEANLGTFVTDDAVALADGWVILDRVQPEGKAVMATRDWARGARVLGKRIGS